MSKRKARRRRSNGGRATRRQAALEEAAEARAAEALRVVTERAVWRLNVMEYVLLGVAGALSLVAGAVAAWGLQASAGLNFRLSWAISSLLFFVIPGTVVFARERRARRSKRVGSAGSSLKENDG